jgi:hypothetical protein
MLTRFVQLSRRVRVHCGCCELQELTRTFKNCKSHSHDADPEKNDVDNLANAEKVGTCPRDQRSGDDADGLWPEQAPARGFAPPREIWQ